MIIFASFYNVYTQCTGKIIMSHVLVKSWAFLPVSSAGMKYASYFDHRGCCLTGQSKIWLCFGWWLQRQHVIHIIFILTKAFSDKLLVYHSELNAFRNVDLGQTSCWRSNRASNEEERWFILLWILLVSGWTPVSISKIAKTTGTCQQECIFIFTVFRKWNFKLSWVLAS